MDRPRRRARHLARDAARQVAAALPASARNRLRWARMPKPGIRSAVALAFACSLLACHRDPAPSAPEDAAPGDADAADDAAADAPADAAIEALAQRAYVKASNTSSTDLFGWSVALS